MRAGYGRYAIPLNALIEAWDIRGVRFITNDYRDTAGMRQAAYRWGRRQNVDIHTHEIDDDCIEVSVEGRLGGWRTFDLRDYDGKEPVIF